MLAKLRYEELVASTTMFLVDEALNDKYNKEIQEKSEVLGSKLARINSMEGLKDYILSDTDALENIICLLNISTEKFKRIISMIRLGKGYTFSSEWDARRTRAFMLEKPDFMDEICKLLLEGAGLKRYQELIPAFFLENFKIDAEVIGRLAIPGMLRSLIKKQLEPTFNSDMANRFMGIVKEELQKICESKGLRLIEQFQYPGIVRPVNFAIAVDNIPKMVVDTNYSITTGSPQTNWRRQVETIYKLGRDKQGMQDAFTYVTILDGAGWVGRQSDMLPVYQSCDFCLNMNHIADLDKIVSQVFH